jgi:putative cell wall-binding protein
MTRMDATTMTTPRRLTALAAAVATAAAMLATAPAALAQINGLESEPTDSDRVSGPTRYETAAELALDGYGDAGAPIAIVATGADFPDALAANYLAGQLDDAEGGPILLTEPNTFTGAARSALDDLDVQRVLLMGGTAAISADVEAQLTAADYTVERVAGATRYETAAAVARRGVAVGELDGLRTALLATGENWPDAMVGGSLAFAGELPLLLTQMDRLHPAAASAIDDLQIEQVVILGGGGVVSDAVLAQLGERGVATRRVSGGDRTATAAQVARLAVDELGFDLTRVNIATGGTFPDALTGGPNAGRVFFASPVLLTQRGGEADVSGAEALGPEPTRFLEENCAFIAAIRVFGGEAAVRGSTADAAQAAAASCDFAL